MHTLILTHSYLHSLSHSHSPTLAYTLTYSHTLIHIHTLTLTHSLTHTYPPSLRHPGWSEAYCSSQVGLDLRGMPVSDSGPRVRAPPPTLNSQRCCPCLPPECWIKGCLTTSWVTLVIFREISVLFKTLQLSILCFSWVYTASANVNSQNTW